MKLYMILVGCRPPGRHTEQHDIFFGIAENLKDLVPEVKSFWPEAKSVMHFDAWREVTVVDGFQVKVIPKTETNGQSETNFPKLFFINLGGYKPHEFEEFHYKMVVAARSKAAAIQQSKNTAFYKHTGFEGANAHIDDKYGIDVDDLYAIEDILPDAAKSKYSLEITAAENIPDDEWHLGYFRLDKL